MKKLRHLAISTFLACNALGAGWDTVNVWPSEDHFRDHTITASLWAVSEVVVTNGSTNVFLTNIRPYKVTANHTNMDLTLRTKDIRGLDGYLSCLERWYALDGANTEANYPGTRPRWYRWERANLVAAKGFLKPRVSSFVDRRTAVSNQWDNAADITMWTVTGLCAYVSAPTNYFEWTPWRQLNGAGTNLPRVVDCSWTITTTNTSVITQAVIDVWGGSRTISGTNGQVVTLPATNVNILSGFGVLDYTWKWYDEIINELVWTLHTASPTNVDYYGPTDDARCFRNCSTALYTEAAEWVNSITNFTTNSGSTAGGEFYSAGVTFVEDTNQCVNGACGNPNYMYASSRRCSQPAVWGITTNVGASVDVYFKAAVGSGSGIFSPSGFRDVDSLGFTNRSYGVYETIGPATTNVWIGSVIGHITTSPFSVQSISCPLSGNSGYSTNITGYGCTVSGLDFGVKVTASKFLFKWNFDYQ